MAAPGMRKFLSQLYLYALLVFVILLSPTSKDLTYQWKTIYIQ